jgi:hypothetical protein
MGRSPSRRLLSVLRATVDQLEKNTDLAPDDPGLVDLKRILLRRIADLQAFESSPLDVVTAPKEPIANLKPTTRNDPPPSTPNRKYSSD